MYCIEVKKAMYGNIDSPLPWKKTLSGYLKNKMQLIQSKTDPCILYKHDNQGQLILAFALYVDDTLCAGTSKALKWMYSKIKEKFNIEELGQLKKHLGIWWTWHKDKNNEDYLNAKMPRWSKRLKKDMRQQLENQQK